MAKTRERVTAETISGLVAVFVDYGLVGIAPVFPVDLSGRRKPALEVGDRFLATGDSVPTYLATVTESLGDGWALVRLDEQLPPEIDSFYLPRY